MSDFGAKRLRNNHSLYKSFNVCSVKLSIICSKKIAFKLVTQLFQVEVKLKIMLKTLYLGHQFIAEIICQLHHECYTNLKFSKYMFMRTIYHFTFTMNEYETAVVSKVMGFQLTTIQF